MRYLVSCSYDGSFFEGFQRLKNGRGVQNELENSLSQIYHQKIHIKGAGRTDAGVHAYQQFFHFDIPEEIQEDEFLYKMNRVLNPYVAVHSIQSVDFSFHARHSVKEKTYLYKVYISNKNPFYYRYVYYFYHKLDVSIMKQCASFFVGRHDFHNFVSGKRDNYISNIQSVIIEEKDGFILFEFKGTSFYRYMVRHMVGALLDVGMGKYPPSVLFEALENPKVLKQFSVVPSDGLYLVHIEY